MKNEEQNLIKPRNSALNICLVIHSLLEKPKYRAIVLVPPMLICVIGMIYAFAHLYFGFAVSPFALPIYFLAAGWLMIGLCIILWSDSKRRKTNCV